MRGLLVSQQSSGVIFKNNPVNNQRGEILSICSSKFNSSGNSRFTKSSQISTCHFIPGGYKLYFALNSGALYCLDFAKNWYNLIASLSSSVTSICSCEPLGYILVGLNDNSIRILDQGSGKEINSLRGHTCRISNISVQPVLGQYVLSVALNEVVLWDLEDYKCRCKLHIGQKINVVSVTFIPPHGEQILSCFQDGSIYAWSTKSLQCLYRLVSRDYPNPAYRTITFTSKGHYLFAAGRSPFVYLWNLQGNSDMKYHETSSTGDGSVSGQFLQELIKLPEPLKSVRRIEWIPKFILVEFDQFYHKFKICDELSGLLLLLGNDKRLRFLIRIYEKPKRTGCSQNSSKNQMSEESDTIYWKCLFTFGLGSLEDPLITSVTTPLLNILDLSGCQGKRHNKSFNCSSLIAILDDHGILHINDLSMTLKVLNSIRSEGSRFF
ncbi:unnamed protein product [Heterobilharzia americana]|nr:unnamed protein product [Heterobilharzia americana]